MTRTRIHCVALLGLFLAFPPASTLAADCSKISATGSATISSAPDVCYVALYVKGDGILMTDAAKAAQEKAAALVEAIRAKAPNNKGIDIQLYQAGEKETKFWSSEQKDQPPRPELTVKLLVTLPASESLAYEVVDVGLRAGAVLQVPSSFEVAGQVKSAIVYGVSNADALDDKLRDQAFEDARKSAQELAKLAGRTLGNVASIGCQASDAWMGHISSEWLRGKYPTKYVGTDPKKLEALYSVSVCFDYAD